MTSPSSPEQAWPVRSVSQKIGGWVDRLGWVWVEGQVAQLSRRPGARTVFVTLRDPVANVSLTVTCSTGTCDAVQPPLADGARVVVHAKPSFYLERGSLSLAADEIRHVGVGELLVRLERLRQLLRAEGLFAPARKRPLPFLPRTVGLVTGRASAAERDVLEVAQRRWPGVRFEVRTVPVQGPSAVTEVTAALRALEQDASVDVVVVARGGGSVEDLLPFSDESLCRLVADMRTPVVSAIGHETDTPLLDLVADVRASTPTDAAKRVVPDVVEEQRLVRQARERAARAVAGRLRTEVTGLAALRSRPVLADPAVALGTRREAVEALRGRARRCTAGRLVSARSDVDHVLARVRALSPQATLERGYAVVQRGDGSVVRHPDEVDGGDVLAVRVAGGRFDARVRADGRLRSR